MNAGVRDLRGRRGGARRRRFFDALGTVTVCLGLLLSLNPVTAAGATLPGSIAANESELRVVQVVTDCDLGNDTVVACELLSETATETSTEVVGVVTTTTSTATETVFSPTVTVTETFAGEGEDTATATVTRVSTINCSDVTFGGVTGVLVVQRVVVSPVTTITSTTTTTTTTTTTSPFSTVQFNTTTTTTVPTTSTDLVASNTTTTTTTTVDELTCTSDLPPTTTTSSRSSTSSSRSHHTFTLPCIFHCTTSTTQTLPPPVTLPPTTTTTASSSASTVSAPTIATTASTTATTTQSTTPAATAEPVPGVRIIKEADPTRLPAGGGNVDYSYLVTNIGNVPLVNVTVVDDTCSPLTFEGVDQNNDQVLELGEEWRYSCSMTITQTTTNIATITAFYNDPGCPTTCLGIGRGTVLQGLRRVQATATATVIVEPAGGVAGQTLPPTDALPESGGGSVGRVGGIVLLLAGLALFAFGRATYGPRFRLGLVGSRKGRRR